MSLDTSALARFADAPPRWGKSTKPAWRPPQPDDLAEGDVLALDQSLGATGWVHLANSEAGPRVLVAGSIATPPGDDLRGPEKNLVRGEEVHEAVGRVMDATGALLVVHETPAVGRGMSRVESSYLAALAVRIAARQRGLRRVMLGAQPAKRLVCGDANADKRVAHAALEEHCAPWIQGYHLVTNEAKRDALMLGLLALSRGAA